MRITTGLTLLAACAAFLTGCANVSSGRIVTDLNEKPTHICIVKNPKVRINAALPSLKAALNRRGIQSTVVDDASQCPCEYRMNYTMRKSWDLTTYLGSVDLSLYKAQTLVSTAKYEAGSMTLTKWGKTEDRIDETVGKLLGEP